MCPGFGSVGPNYGSNFGPGWWAQVWDQIQVQNWEEFVPKHHVIFHPLQQTMEKGNPWYYGSWLDEGLNKQLKNTCKNASQATFESTTLCKMKENLKTLERGVKRK